MQVTGDFENRSGEKSKTYRVIQVGAGSTGRFALRSILTHPGLDLVGLAVRSEHNSGRDAGAFCNLPPTTVRATRDTDSLLAMRADCVSFMPADDYAGDVLDGGSEAARAFDLLCRFLASGKNVIASSPNSLVYAPALGDVVVTRLEEACAAGDSSFLYVGVSPGFMPDRLVLNLTAVSARIESIAVKEFMNYSEYENPNMLLDYYGFGKDPNVFDPTQLLLSFHRSLGGSVAMIADGLGVELEAVAMHIDLATTERPLEIPVGTIHKGTIGGSWITASGMVKGKPCISVAHVTRIGNDVAPAWPRFRDGSGEGYQIDIVGAPAMSVDVELGAFGRNPMADAGWAVGGHIANSVAALCQAPSGIRTFIDLPAATGRHRMIAAEQP